MPIGAPWPIDGSYIFSAEDYVYAHVIEDPYGYFVMPSRLCLYVWIYPHGLVRVKHDMRGYHALDIASLVRLVRKRLQN